MLCVFYIGTHFFLLRKSTGESIVGAAAKNIYWFTSCVGDFIYILLPLLWQFFLISSGPNLWSSVAKKYYHRRTHTLPALNSTRDTNKYIKGSMKKARVRHARMLTGRLRCGRPPQISESHSQCHGQSLRWRSSRSSPPWLPPCCSHRRTPSPLTPRQVTNNFVLNKLVFLGRKFFPSKFIIAFYKLLFHWIFSNSSNT